jgi:very-short-patch-repair endonuclease
MQTLLERGYRVQPQVGSLGFRIDMVVEGADGRRLAVECDGDRFHGPEQWREDMRRQRVLERVGWRFWRCFASSFYRDKDRVIADLFETLSRMGIEPIPKGASEHPSGRFTEHRTIAVAEEVSRRPATRGSEKQSLDNSNGHAVARDGVAIGDKIVLRFCDDQSRISLCMTEGMHDIEKGLLSSESTLGKSGQARGRRR